MYYWLMFFFEVEFLMNRLSRLSSLICKALLSFETIMQFFSATYLAFRSYWFQLFSLDIQNQYYCTILLRETYIYMLLCSSYFLKSTFYRFFVDSIVGLFQSFCRLIGLLEAYLTPLFRGGRSFLLDYIFGITTLPFEAFYICYLKYWFSSLRISLSLISPYTIWSFYYIWITGLFLMFIVLVAQFRVLRVSQK